MGPAKRVPMASLRAMLRGLGYSNIATLLNSGNAVFGAARGSARDHATAIASVIANELNLQVPVIVKSVEELASIVLENPFTGEDINASRLLVAFASDTASLAALGPIAARVRPPDRFFLGSSAAYAYCPAGTLASPVGAALLAQPGNSVTTRNGATTLKLLALASSVQALA